MSQEKFVKAITYLTTIYDDKKFDKQKTIVWYDFFKKYSFNDFIKAIKNIAVKNKYFPSIAELKAELNEISTSTLNPMLEFENVKSAIRRYGSYREQELLKSLDPYTARIVKKVGLSRLCSMTDENRQWLEKEFINTFNDYKNVLNEPEFVDIKQLENKDVNKMLKS